MVAGVPFHTGTRVVLWSDPRGFSAYGTEGPAPLAPVVATGPGQRSVLRYGSRVLPLTNAEAKRVELDGWAPEILSRYVDQFVIHFDAAGTSRECFRVLHYVRGLSVHFMIDLDGTIYQTLDVRERAWHATISNDRSVGVELANIGAFDPGTPNPLSRWYEMDGAGARLSVPPEFRAGSSLEGLQLRPARPGPIEGRVQGQLLRMYDYTPQQYESLSRLAAALHSALPRIALEYPRETDGSLAIRTLDSGRWAAFRGLLGHYHIQQNKVDPGPAFQWDLVVARSRELSRE